MPDLITHMSINYLLGRSFRRHFSLTLFLLGAVLTDVIVAAQITLIDFFHFKDIEYLYSIGVFPHTLFGAVTISIILGIYFVPRVRSIFSLFSGYLLHLLVDLFQFNFGNGNLLFYPFGFRTYTLDCFIYGVDYRLIYVVIPLFLFLYILFKEKERLDLEYSRKAAVVSVSGCLLLFLAALYFSPRVLMSDYYFLKFRFHPEIYDNKVIKIDMGNIRDQKDLIVLFRHHKLTLRKVKMKPEPGYRYKIVGIYRHREGSLEVLRLYKVYPYAKLLISGAGILLFMFFILVKVKIRITRE
ncbi:MAG: hypothetical protein PHF84_01005 [bacterium]|nr:hypothetical protein [bacterium]